MPQPMALKPTTIRFAEDGFDFVQRAANAVGSSMSQFVREAALIRAALILGEQEEMRKIAEQVRQLARDGD